MVCGAIFCSCCCNLVEKWTHQGHLIDIHDTVEAAGTMIGHTTVTLWYLIVRILFAIGIVSITIWSFIRYVEAGVPFLWFVYITHWGLILNSIYMCSSVLLHLQIYIKTKNNSDNNNNKYSSIKSLGLRNLWLWTLYFLNISMAISFFVIILYWGIIYTPDTTVIPITWNTHGTVGVLMFIEWFTSTWQLTYKGSLFLFITAVAWVFVSVIFYISHSEDVDGNRYIYNVIDWGNEPGTAALYCLVVCTAIPVTHVLFVALKNTILRCWLDSRTEEEKSILIVTKDSNKDVELAATV